MKFELKGFQTTSAGAILEELDDARAGAKKGKLQAVVLSAPTGSGKTITLAAVIEWTFGGADGIAARPNTTFLWLSDSPELNLQSKNKLIAACDRVPYHRLETVESASFDEPRLSPGHVYFINTQLLGKDKLLTKGGDAKTFTFWQTVKNTIEAAPGDFVLIIDEAHRGAGITDKARKPIMQKFIMGSEVDGLPPVPLVLGMSATPQRFTELLGNTNRIQRPVNIAPEAVRSSGLLKDWIIVTCPENAAKSDLTLLENAAARWAFFRERWDAYCSKEKEKSPVKPVLVVQVEDGSGTNLTSTPLEEAVRVIQRQTGPLAVNEIVHCFQEKEEISYGGCIIRRMDASRIQDSSEVKVVLFKTALTTGWDCPRAEVMMSFRRAQDPTSIAQLVGRMIRTPLARRIESEEVLNTVELFLPHYDAVALEGVLTRLRSPEEHEGVPTKATTDAETYERNPDFADVFEYLEGLQTYSVNRAPKMREIKRVLRLSSMLVHGGIDTEADEQIRELLTSKLNELRDRYAAKDKNWTQALREGEEIEVNVSSVAIGPMNISNRDARWMKRSAEDIDHLFEESGRLLASGEGLHRTYWKRYHDHAKPDEAKLELSAVVRMAETQIALEQLAMSEFEKLQKRHQVAIRKLPAAERARFQRLVQASGRAVLQDWELPDSIVEKPGDAVWKDHLYVNGNGEFSAVLNTWESAFLDWAKKSDGFVCWLRNPAKRDWAFCVPYDHGGEKPFYPDFVIVRKEGDEFVVDLLEPHNDDWTDTWAKAKGLAKFADEHGADFGRLMMGRVNPANKLQIVDVADAKTREKARKMVAAGDLESLFQDC